MTGPGQQSEESLTAMAGILATGQDLDTTLR